MPSPRRPQFVLASVPPIGLFGLGAFGRFALPHLQTLAPVVAHDPFVTGAGGATLPLADLATTAGRPIVVFAVPLAALADLAAAAAPHMRPGALVVDVCSVKSEPLAILRAALPAHVDVVGTHPLFGPNSAAAGLAGLEVAICGGRRSRVLARVLRERLGLATVALSAEDHDREMAYVQGVTHLVARALGRLEAPPLRCRTRSYGLLEDVVRLVGSDSDQLFRTILQANAFAGPVVGRFAEAVEALATQASAAARADVS